MTSGKAAVRPQRARQRPAEVARQPRVAWRCASLGLAADPGCALTHLARQRPCTLSGRHRQHVRGTVAPRHASARPCELTVLGPRRAGLQEFRVRAPRPGLGRRRRVRSRRRVRLSPASRALLARTGEQTSRPAWRPGQPGCGAPGGVLAVRLRSVSRSLGGVRRGVARGEGRMLAGDLLAVHWRRCVCLWWKRYEIYVSRA